MNFEVGNQADYIISQPKDTMDIVLIDLLIFTETYNRTLI